MYREEAKELQSRYSKSEIPLTTDNIPGIIKRYIATFGLRLR